MLLEFPWRQQSRLQVSITTIDEDGTRHTIRNNVPDPGNDNLQQSLQGAQAEVVQQEIFSLLITEAGNLPTASARVSERIVVIDAAQATELSFELVSPN